MRDGKAHPSPNAGRLEASFAGALSVRLGGRNIYDGRVELRPNLGAGGPPAIGDIRRAVRLSRAISVTSVGPFAGAAWCLRRSTTPPLRIFACMATSSWSRAHSPSPPTSGDTHGRRDSSARCAGPQRTGYPGRPPGTRCDRRSSGSSPTKCLTGGACESFWLIAAPRPRRAACVHHFTEPEAALRSGPTSSASFVSPTRGSSIRKDSTDGARRDWQSDNPTGVLESAETLDASAARQTRGR